MTGEHDPEDGVGVLPDGRLHWCKFAFYLDSGRVEEVAVLVHGPVHAERVGYLDPDPVTGFNSLNPPALHSDPPGGQFEHGVWSEYDNPDDEDPNPGTFDEVLDALHSSASRVHFEDVSDRRWFTADGGSTVTERS